MTNTLGDRFSRRWGAAAAIALTTALAVSGCSSPQPSISETVPGLPSGVTLTDVEQQGDQPVAVWTDNRVTLTIVTWGSSSCPPVPTSLVAESEASLELRFAAPTDQACTADYAPTSHVFTTPDGFSVGAVQLDIVFEARAGDQPREVTVPIRDPE